MAQVQGDTQNNTNSKRGSDSHPSGNTGAERTTSLAGRWGFDWLAVTIPAQLDVEQLLPGVPASEWDEADRGFRGYPKSMDWEGAIVGYGGRADMGTHLSLNSQAMAHYASRVGLRSWDGLISHWVNGLGGHVTRLDVFFDDFAGNLTLRRILEATRGRQWVTRLQKFSYTRGLDIEEARSTGWTCYFGSRKGEQLIRIYDKLAEQQNRQPTGDDGQELSVKQWVRLEYELHQTAADALARLYIEKGQERLREALHGIIRPVLEGTDKNQRRREVAHWWAAVLGTLRHRPYVRHHRRLTVDGAVAWLERTAGPTLALVTAANEGDIGAVLEIASKASKRWRERHLIALQEYREALRPGTEPSVAYDQQG